MGRHTRRSKPSRNQPYIKHPRKSLNPLICHWTITLLPGTMLFVKKYLGYLPHTSPYGDIDEFHNKRLVQYHQLGNSPPLGMPFDFGIIVLVICRAFLILVLFLMIYGKRHCHRLPITRITPDKIATPSSSFSQARLNSSAISRLARKWEILISVNNLISAIDLILFFFCLPTITVVIIANFAHCAASPW